jgi:hypothetical protein
VVSVKKQDFMTSHEVEYLLRETLSEGRGEVSGKESGNLEIY